MLDVALSGIPEVLQPNPATMTIPKAPPVTARRPRLTLRSRLPGRERWFVDRLEDSPLLAAAVELVLRSEDGIDEVRANPLTGRVLVRYRPDSLSESVEALVRRALEAGPMSQEEFEALRSNQPASYSKQLLTAEVACCLSHMILFGGLCPVGLAATGVLLLLHRRSRGHAHA